MQQQNKYSICRIKLPTKTFYIGVYLAPQLLMLTLIYESLPHKNNVICHMFSVTHDYVMKWKHFPRYWSFVREIRRSPVNYPHKCQWRGVLMFSLICTWLSGWVNNKEPCDLRRHCVHYYVTVMPWKIGTAANLDEREIQVWHVCIDISNSPYSTSCHCHSTMVKTMM